MKASPSARSWIAAGVRHELLTRALPALRHDMAAPVSVIRMALLMLKRQVAAPQVDAAGCEERLTLVDQQIGELVTAIRSLRDWELAIGDDGVTRGALVAQCSGLMRAAFDLHGTSLDVESALAAKPEEALFRNGAALRYLLLGALGYLNDSLEDAGVIAITADGPDALQLTAATRHPGNNDRVLDAHRAPRALAIDAIALQSLADDLGYALTVAPDAVRFALVPG